MDLHLLWEGLIPEDPHQVLVRVALAVCMVLYIGIQWYKMNRPRRERDSKWVREDLAPAQLFLQELSKGSSVGHDKQLIAMLHPSLLAVTEKGIIRAVGRCVANGHGTFECFDERSVSVKQNETSCHVFAKAQFSKSKEAVKVDVAWMKSREGDEAVRSGSWAIVCFNIAAPPGQLMDICSFIDADEFSAFGEKVVTSLVSKVPTFMHGVMMPQLKARYDSPSDIAVKVSPFINACGGLKVPNRIDVTLVKSCVSASVTGTPTTNGSGRRIDLLYHVMGGTRDIEVEISLAIAEMQCFVAKYNMKALAPSQREVIVEV